MLCDGTATERSALCGLLYAACSAEGMAAGVLADRLAEQDAVLALLHLIVGSGREHTQAPTVMQLLLRRLLRAETGLVRLIRTLESDLLSRCTRVNNSCDILADRIYSAGCVEGRTV